MTWSRAIGLGETRPGEGRLRVAYALALLLPALTAYAFHLADQDAFDLEIVAFAIAILVCSLLGGTGPGLLCTVLVALITKYHFVPPIHSFAITAGPEYSHWLSLLAGGIVLSVLTVVLRDSVRRRVAEDALEQSELKFRQITDTVEEVFWLSTPDASAILYVSPGFEKVWGRSCEELYRKPTLWSEAIHPQDVALVRKSLEELARGKEYDIEFRIRHADGTERWISDRGYVRRDVVGNVILTSGIATDITGRRQMAESLLESERRLASIVASAMDGVISIDDNQRITLANFAAEKMFDRSATKMLGKPLVDLIPQRYRAGHPAHVEAFGSSGETQRAMGRLGVVYGLRTDGTEFPIEASISQVEFDGKKQYTAIFRDVTQRLENERHITRLTRIYAVLSGINSAIVRIRDRQTLFEEACRIAVDLGEFRLSWIGLLNGDSGAIVPAAMRGPEKDLAVVRDTPFTARSGVFGGTGPVGKAVRSGKAAYNNDLDSDPESLPGLAQLHSRGYRSTISLPLNTQGRTAGVMTLYSTEPGAFDAQELELLRELAGDVGFAMEFIVQEDRVKFLAFHDPLTALPNRTRLRRDLEETVEKASAKAFPFALLLININGFRDINDSLGHRNGDLLLQEIAERLRTAVWENDIAASLGGDEFAVLLPHLAETGHIDLVSRKITDALQKPFVIQGLPINVEARIGIALYPDHGNSANLLWQHADVALRASKELHRTQLLYATGIDHFDPAKLALVGGLRKAIDDNELVLHYQPKINLKTGHAMGVEALLRWQHPERGLIFPDAFIPLVERTGLINPLTTWVLRDALRQGHAWDEGGLPLDLSVNLSARNLQASGLSAEILDLVRASRFPLDRLTLEITESAIMVDPEGAKSVLGKLHEAGIQISMDDFGIGQSSLTYLKDLPISRMKIDKSFVMKFDEPRNAAIVRSAIELGHNLGLAVTAEGVESRATYLALCALRCDTAQGYYFSKPLPAERLTEWLRSSEWK